LILNAEPGAVLYSTTHIAFLCPVATVAVIFCCGPNLDHSRVTDKTSRQEGRQEIRGRDQYFCAVGVDVLLLPLSAKPPANVITHIAGDLDRGLNARPITRKSDLNMFLR
jgi:hypothetical protein